MNISGAGAKIANIAKYTKLVEARWGALADQLKGSAARGGAGLPAGGNRPGPGHAADEEAQDALKEQVRFWRCQAEELKSGPIPPPSPSACPAARRPDAA